MTTNLEEAMLLVETEGLSEYASYDTKLQADKIYLVPQDSSWLVYSTDERAAIYGSIEQFDTMEIALPTFLKRLRAAQRIEQRQRQRRGA